MILKSEPYISDSELKETLLGALEGRQLNKVLLLPPDYTRLYSGAGKITAVYYEADRKSTRLNSSHSSQSRMPSSA